MKNKKTAFPCFAFALSALLLCACANDVPPGSSPEVPIDPSTSETSPSATEDSSPADPGPSTSDAPSSTPAETIVKTIRFGEAKYADSASLDNGDFERDGLEVELESQEKCYSDGVGSAVRVGSSKHPGSFTLSFRGDYAPTSIGVYSFAYNETSPYVLNLALDGESFSSKELTSAALSGEASFVVPWGKELHSLTISSTKRFCLASIAFSFGGELPPAPPSEDSSSSVPTPPSEDSSSTVNPPLPDSSTSRPDPIVPDLGSYYDSVNFSLTGAALKSALSKRISSPYENKGYAYAYTAYLTTDTGEDGYIMDMYSSVKFDPVSDHQGAPGKTNYKKEGDMYNREHTIPQSVFNERAPMKSDLHHLLPTDGYVNNRRSNYPHAYVNPSTVKYTSTNGTIVGTGDARNHGYSSNCCEVIDEYKGDIARIYFYFVTRYEKELPGMGSYACFDKKAYPGLSNWAMQTYLEWNDMDPISEKEIARNEAIFAIQKNRNPFVDVPDLAHRVWGAAVK